METGLTMAPEEDIVWSAADYKPDPLIVHACDWAKRQGLRNQDFSAVRRGDRVEIIDCRFDMAVSMAWVSYSKDRRYTFAVDRV